MNEETYQPNRIQVLRQTDKSHSYSRNKEYTYTVIMRNMTIMDDESIVQRWCVLRHTGDDIKGFWENDASKKPSVTIGKSPTTMSTYSKKDAIAIAKYVAELEDLPFTQSKDIVDSDELIYGPHQECLVCSDSIGRGFDSNICADCRRHCSSSIHADQPRNIAVAIDANSFTGLSGFRDDVNSVFFLAIAKLTGMEFHRPERFTSHSTSSSVHIANPKRLNQLGKLMSGMTSEVRVGECSQDMVDGLRLLVDEFVNARTKEYRNGHNTGEGFLTRIANGDMSPVDIEDRQTRTGEEKR